MYFLLFTSVAAVAEFELKMLHSGPELQYHENSTNQNSHTFGMSFSYYLKNEVVSIDPLGLTYRGCQLFTKGPNSLWEVGLEPPTELLNNVPAFTRFREPLHGTGSSLWISI